MDNKIQNGSSQSETLALSQVLEMRTQKIQCVKETKQNKTKTNKQEKAGIERFRCLCLITKIFAICMMLYIWILGIPKRRKDIASTALK